MLADGSIDGSPTQLGDSNHTITISNEGGSVETAIRIIVLHEAPMGLGYGGPKSITLTPTDFGISEICVISPDPRLVAHIGGSPVERKGGVGAVIVGLPSKVGGARSSAIGTDISQHGIVNEIFSSQWVIDPNWKMRKRVKGVLSKWESPSSVIRR